MNVTLDDVKRVMEKYQQLNRWGFLFRRKDGRQSKEDYENEMNGVRAELLGAECLEEINKCAAWINQYISPIQCFNTKRTSYGLKHFAEHRCGYISNGAFIVAALLCGYKCSFHYNPHFNMSEKSIKRSAIGTMYEKHR